jgi:hypothetical protein
VKSKPIVRDLKVKPPAVKIDHRDVDVITQITDVVVNVLRALLIVTQRLMANKNQESLVEVEEVVLSKQIGKASKPRNPKKLPL